MNSKLKRKVDSEYSTALPCNISMEETTNESESRKEYDKAQIHIDRIGSLVKKLKQINAETAFHKIELLPGSTSIMIFQKTGRIGDAESN